MTSLSWRAVVTAEERAYTAGIGNNLLFETRLIEGADAVLDAVASASASSEFGVFQAGPWLSAVYGDLAPGHQAWPVAVEVRTASGELALLLPLLATHEKGLDVLRVPSLWVSDYGGPLLGPAAPANDAGAAALWRAMKSALAGYDLIIVENMPHSIGERPNPLALIAAARPAEHQRNALHIEGSVEDMLRARGKKYRKEAERCARLLAERGMPTFKRAESEEEIAHGYAILQEQQALRRRATGGGYVLDQPDYMRFYETVLRQGFANGQAHLFTLGAGAEVGACLLGVTHAGVFTLLRIATAGGNWSRISPGRLIVLEAMRYFLPRGVRTFDMGIGDYPFKQGFGIQPEPLATLEAPLSRKGWPRYTLRRLRAWARGHERLRALVRYMKGKVYGRAPEGRAAPHFALNG